MACVGVSGRLRACAGGVGVLGACVRARVRRTACGRMRCAAATCTLNARISHANPQIHTFRAPRSGAALATLMQNA